MRNKQYIYIRLTVEEAEALLIRTNSEDEDEPEIIGNSERAEHKIRYKLNKFYESC